MLNSKQRTSSALTSGPSRVVVAVDGSDYSMKAADYAINLAKNTGAEIIALNIIDISSIFRMLPPTTKKELNDIGKQEARRMFQDVEEMAKKRGVEMRTEIIETSESVADAMIRYAEKKKIDLIVVGTKGKSGMTKALLGSVASKIVTYSPCPVLVVR
jgi:nucleotide-binding universal stress UspA family protein